MKVQIKSSLKLDQKTQCLVVALKPLKKISSQCSELNAATNKMIDRLQQNEQFAAKEGEIKIISAVDGLGAQNLVLVGTGDSRSLTIAETRDVLKNLAKALKQESITEVVTDMSALAAKSNTETVSRHLVEAIGDATYQYTKLPKAKNAKSKSKEIKLTICCPDRKQASLAKVGANTGLAIENGKTLAKDLGNAPGNVCTPTYLASQARKLGKSNGLKVKILSEKDMADLGMGSLLSVSKGSREPAKLIVMEYAGAKNKKDAPHVLVGKGLTFDAGGISLKPSAKMDEMKYDMCGAASVFGTMLAAAELGLSINLVGIVPSSENLPDGIANKPGDVVTSMAGITIEILNTDAEGRLILCDALTYAERYKPKSVIDIATLTGAVIVALGHQTAGVMGNDQAVIDEVLAAGEQSLDYAWQLPINESYKRQLKSDFADLANIGGPSAGTITAACFLSYFTEKFNWAHLDIAGTAWGGEAGKLASGRAVPVLTQYLINQQ